MTNINVFTRAVEKLNLKLILKIAKSQRTEFSKMYKGLADIETYQPPREVYLRPSMLPVCSMTLLDMMVAFKNQEESGWGYGPAYFTSVGTQVHETIQFLCAHAGYTLWGNWKCPNCGHFWEHSENHICEKCDTIAGYEEIELEYGGFKGHIDCILLTPKGVLIGDYKTSTQWKLKKNFSSMNVAYALQLMTYVLMLKKVWGKHFAKMGYPIRGASLLFLSRDNPFKSKEIHFPFSQKMERMAKFLMVRANLAIMLARRASESGDLRQVMRHKSCKTKLQYLNKVKPFHVYEDCWLSDVCFDKKRVKKHFKGRLKIKEI